MKLNDPLCPRCGMDETAHAEYPDPKGDSAEFLCMACGHHFVDNLYGESKRPIPIVRPELIRIIGIRIKGQEIK